MGKKKKAVDEIFEVYVVLDELSLQYEICDNADQAEAAIGEFMKTNETHRDDIRVIKGRKLDFTVGINLIED